MLAKIQQGLYWITAVWIQEYAEYAKFGFKSMDLCINAVADPGFPVRGVWISDTGTFWLKCRAGSRIFHTGGVDPFWGGFGLQHGHFSVKMYAKMKELGPVGRHAPARPLDLPMKMYAKMKDWVP